MQLFCGIQCIRHDCIRGHIDMLLKEVGLFGSKNTPSSALSGGMKRKLQVVDSPHNSRTHQLRHALNHLPARSLTRAFAHPCTHWRTRCRSPWH